MPVLRDTIEQATNRATRNVWGVQLVYTPLDEAAISTRAVDGEPLTAVFDSAAEVVELLDGAPISARRPLLDMTLEDLGREPAPGDKFTISEGAHAGETFTVADVLYDSAQAAQLVCVAGDHAV